MNYIRHLNAFFSYVKNDNQLTTSHVSLYMALFQYWNFNRFNNPFYIYRENIMQLSKIGSKNTYHKCIKQLHEAKYIFYHPATSKYQPIRISIIRLDREEQTTKYQQLDLFPPLEGVILQSKIGAGISPNNKTTHVPLLTDASTNIDTSQVPKKGQYIKPNFNKQRETPAHEFFKRNDKIQKSINDLAGVSNQRHDTKESLSFRADRGISDTSIIVPSQQEVEIFFNQHKHPKEEAIKFFNHYKSLHWKLQGKTPILDWRPLVEKWMQNAKKWDLSSAGGGGAAKSRDGGGQEKDLQHLYNSFLQGHKIFKYILPEHFDQLNLELTEETLQNARSERINQVSGTNQHSLNNLWQAYLTGNPNNELVIRDTPNLIALAKRIAVIKHFHKLKEQPQ